MVTLYGYDVLHRGIGNGHARGPRKGGCHLDKVASMATARWTHGSYRLAIHSSKPLQGVFQVTPVPASWTPDKHPRDWFVTNEAHCHTATAVLTDLPDGA